MEEVVIIGAGPAGIMAAIEASKKYKVTILEKEDKLGKKLRITGKGRCNITFKGDRDYFFNHVVENAKFMYSSFNMFNNEDLVKYVNSIFVETKEERGNRIFLKSDDANQLAMALEKELKKHNVKVLYNSKVENVEKINEKFIIILSNGKKIEADKCIVATGGKSYPATGSTGDGYKIAKKFEHDVKEIRPGLVGLKSSDSICKKMQGLTLKNVRIKVYNNEKVIYSDFGEMMFSHFGVTGPIILSSSSKIVREKDYIECLKKKNIMLEIDLKPALSEEKLYSRICRDLEKYNNKEIKNSLNELLPKKLIPVVISKANLDENKKSNSVTKEERNELMNTLKHFSIVINDVMPVETGIVTVGGINLKEINPRTFESKKISNLYFIGEVLDIDAYTGGFNLQIAFSTGYSCGKLL